MASIIENFGLSFNQLRFWQRNQLVWGNRIQAKSFDRLLYLWMHRWGFMGATERTLLGRLVRPGMTAVDIGANLGLYSVLLARLVGPEGQVFSFEPDPELYSLLSLNAEGNCPGNIKPHQIALGSKPSRMFLQRLVLNSGDNHLGNNENKAFRRPVEVEVAAFDDLYPDLRPDFVKIDVQGWELKVLRGMQRTLRASDDVGVYLELWPNGLKRADDSPEELYDFVCGLDLRFYSCGDWKVIDKTSFLATAKKTKGLNHVDLFASRSLPKFG